jgi:hypothetical protein
MDLEKSFVFVFGNSSFLTYSLILVIQTLSKKISPEDGLNKFTIIFAIVDLPLPLFAN